MMDVWGTDASGDSKSNTEGRGNGNASVAFQEPAVSSSLRRKAAYKAAQATKGCRQSKAADSTILHYILKIGNISPWRGIQLEKPSFQLGQMIVSTRLLA